MINVGEQLVASYLRHIRNCDFIQTNLYTTGSQGEIDVVGINLKQKTVYVCEVAIHLTTGLQYVKEKRPNNINKLTEKFSRDIQYAREYLSAYEHVFMLWSPIVKDSKGNPQYNQLAHLQEIKNNLLASFGINLQCIVNEQFQSCLQEMRAFAASQTAELKCPLLRLLQLEALLEKHLSKTKKLQ